MENYLKYQLSDFEKKSYRDAGYEDGYADALERGREEGREEGQQQERLAIARAMLSNGIAAELVSASTGLSIDEVRKLVE